MIKTGNVATPLCHWFPGQWDLPPCGVRPTIDEPEIHGTTLGTWVSCPECKAAQKAQVDAKPAK